MHLCTAGVCTPFPVPDGFPCETEAVCTVGQCAAGVCEEVPIASPPGIVDVAVGFGGHDAGAVAIGEGRLVIVDRITRETLRLSTVTFGDAGGETVWAGVRTLPAQAPAGRVQLLRVGDKVAIREGQGPFTRLVGPGPDDVVEPIPQDEGPVMWIEGNEVLRAVCVPIEGLDAAWMYRWHDGVLDERVGVAGCRPRAFAVAGDRLFSVTAPGALAVSTLEDGLLASEGHWLSAGVLGVVASGDHVLAHQSATAGLELGAGTWRVFAPDGQSRFSMTTTAAPLIVGDDAIFDNSQGLVTRSLLVAEGLWAFSAPVDGALSTDGDTLVARSDKPWVGPRVLRRNTTFLPRSPAGMGDKQRVVGPFDAFVWLAGPSGIHFALEAGDGLVFEVSARQSVSGVIDNQDDGPQLSSAVIGEPGMIGVGARLGSFGGAMEILGTTAASVDRYSPPSEGPGPQDEGEWSVVVDALWSPADAPLPRTLPLGGNPADMVPKLAFSASGDLAVFVPWGPPRLMFIDVSPTELTIDGEVPMGGIVSLAYDDDRVAFVTGPEPVDPVSPEGLAAVEVWLREGSELTLVGEVPDLEGPRVLRFLDRFLAVDTAGGLLYVDTTASPPEVVAELPVEGRITDARVIDGELLVVTPQDLVVIDPPCPAL